MIKTNRRIVALAIFAFGLCLVSPAIAQETDGSQMPKIVRKSGGVLQGSATRRVEPVYPPLAKAAQVSGSVVVEVTVDEEGNVFAARALSGHPLLKDPAVAAARGWKFSPTTLESVPVKVIGTITFNFALGGARTIEELEAQVRENPGSYEAHLKLADAYTGRSRNDEAVAEYSEAIRIRPDIANTYFALGQTYDRLGRVDDAREAFAQAVRVDALGGSGASLADGAYVAIAKFHYGRAAYQDAVDVLKQAASIYPDRDDIHLELGRIYVELKDWVSALNEYTALKDKKSEFAQRLIQQIEKRQQ